MAACLKARCNHYVDSSLLQFDGFVRRGCGSERDDPSLPRLVQYLFWWDAVDKREGGNVGVEKHPRLILKPDRLVRCKFLLCAAECFDVCRRVLPCGRPIVLLCCAAYVGLSHRMPLSAGRD